MTPTLLDSLTHHRHMVETGKESIHFSRSTAAAKKRQGPRACATECLHAGLGRSILSRCRWESRDGLRPVRLDHHRQRHNKEINEQVQPQHLSTATLSKSALTLGSIFSRHRGANLDRCRQRITILRCLTVSWHYRRAYTITSATTTTRESSSDYKNPA